MTIAITGLHARSPQVRQDGRVPTLDGRRWMVRTASSAVFDILLTAALVPALHTVAHAVAPSPGFHRDERAARGQPLGKVTGKALGTSDPRHSSAHLTQKRPPRSASLATH